MKKIKLDTYEQGLENRFEALKTAQDKDLLITQLNTAAKEHVKNKKPITIRVSIEDLAAIKVKAAHYGIPYQTYLNMLIHNDAQTL